MSNARQKSFIAFCSCATTSTHTWLLARPAVLKHILSFHVIACQALLANFCDANLEKNKLALGAGC